MHHSQQDLKNRVSQPKIKGLTISHSQETRFFTQVQDVSQCVSSKSYLIFEIYVGEPQRVRGETITEGGFGFPTEATGEAARMLSVFPQLTATAVSAALTIA